MYYLTNNDPGQWLSFVELVLHICDFLCNKENIILLVKTIFSSSVLSFDSYEVLLCW